MPDSDSRNVCVSVVVPTYKLADYLPATLSSLKQQTLHNYEVIIVDDGSPDDVRGAAEPFTSADCRFRYVRQENRGLPAARNFGYRNCHPDSSYVYFLDADDVLEPDALKEMAGHLDRFPEAGMVHCPARRIDDHGKPIGPDNWPRGWAYGPRLIGKDETVTPLEAIYILSSGIICSVALLRRKTYDQTGGFDEEFGHHHEDTNVFISMALKAQVHCVSRRLVRYRVRPNQMSNDAKGLGDQAERLYRKWTTAANLRACELATVQAAESFRTSGALQYARTVHSARHLWECGNRITSLRVLFGAWRRRVTFGYR